ncbi:MAG TPA: hypothetical protein VH592_10580 [Gemmataceae bacterium]|jgi:hypothetical protein
MIVMKPRFKLGALVATPGALEVLEKAGVPLWSLVSRHVSGNFGEVDEHDRQANEEAIASGDRVLSAYTVAGERVWVITEADRSSTCVLLASEY